MHIFVYGFSVGGGGAGQMHALNCYKSALAILYYFYYIFNAGLLTVFNINSLFQFSINTSVKKFCKYSEMLKIQMCKIKNAIQHTIIMLETNVTDENMCSLKSRIPSWHLYLEMV